MGPPPCRAPSGIPDAQGKHQESLPLKKDQDAWHAECSYNVPRRILDPLERTSEILFGIIMVLTFTGSIRVAEAGREDSDGPRGAIGCNLAWGWSMRRCTSWRGSRRARASSSRSTISAGRVSPNGPPCHSRNDAVAALGGADAAEVETLRQRLNQEPLSSIAVKLTRADFVGAAGVFLLVFLSTFPVVVPLIVVREPRLALSVSNTVAVSMLFILGWSLGRYAGQAGLAERPRHGGGRACARRHHDGARRADPGARTTR